MWMVVDGWLDGYVDGCGWLLDGFSMVVDSFWMVFGWLVGWLLDGCLDGYLDG